MKHIIRMNKFRYSRIHVIFIHCAKNVHKIADRLTKSMVVMNIRRHRHRCASTDSSPKPSLLKHGYPGQSFASARHNAHTDDITIMSRHFCAVCTDAKKFNRSIVLFILFFFVAAAPAVVLSSSSVVNSNVAQLNYYYLHVTSYSLLYTSLYHHH